MPFRKNHASDYRCGFYMPVERKLTIDGDKTVIENVDVFGGLPDVEEFSPEVQLKAGIPPKSMSTVFIHPSSNEMREHYQSVADSLVSGELVEKPVEKTVEKPVETSVKEN